MTKGRPGLAAACAQWSADALPLTRGRFHELRGPARKKKKKAINQKESTPEAWPDAVGAEESLRKPQGEDSGVFQVRSQPGLSSVTHPRASTEDERLGLA